MPLQSAVCNASTEHLEALCRRWECENLRFSGSCCETISDRETMPIFWESYETIRSGAWGSARSARRALPFVRKGN